MSYHDYKMRYNRQDKLKLLGEQSWNDEAQ